MTPTITVIIPTYNEEKYIKFCIDSVISQDYPIDSLEVLIIDGLSEDKTREVIFSYLAKHHNIKLIDNPDRIVPIALNIGIKISKGDVIIRLDGHCIYPKNYLSVLVKNLYALNADNVGGVWNTLPARNNSLCRAIAVASSHKFGVGNSKHKIGATEIIETDTVPFGCYRREIFDKIGLFDEDLIRNQDDEFNARIIKNGGKIFIIPTLVIDYIARDSINKMSKMYYQYGLFKPLVNRKLGHPATIRQFFPPAFVIGLFIGAIFSCFSKMAMLLYICLLVIYFLIAIFFACNLAIENKDWKLIYNLPFVFLTIHLSYGFGYIFGVYKIINKKPFNVKINR